MINSRVSKRLRHSKATDNIDIWYYNFGDDKRLFVYFIDGILIEVRDKQDIGI